MPGTELSSRQAQDSLRGLSKQQLQLFSLQEERRHDGELLSALFLGTSSVRLPASLLLSPRAMTTSIPRDLPLPLKNFGPSMANTKSFFLRPFN